PRCWRRRPEPRVRRTSAGCYSGALRDLAGVPDNHALLELDRTLEAHPAVPLGLLLAEPAHRALGCSRALAEQPIPLADEHVPAADGAHRHPVPTLRLEPDDLGSAPWIRKSRHSGRSTTPVSAATGAASPS